MPTSTNEISQAVRLTKCTLVKDDQLKLVRPIRTNKISQAICLTNQKLVKNDQPKVSQANQN